MPIHLNCPNGHALRVKDNLAGQSGTCPTCGTTFVVPAQPSQEAPAAARPVAATPQALPPSVGDSAEAAVEWRVTLADGSQFGPTVSVVFAQWIAAGRVPADALVWRTGWPDWRRAEEAAADLPATLPGANESPAAPPAPALPRGVTLPPAVAGTALPHTSGGKSASEVSYSLRKRREARRRRKFVLGLMVACLVLTAMLVVMMLTGPPENAPVVPQ